MGNFAGNLFSASVNTNFASMLNDTTESVRQQCGSGNTSSGVIDQVEIKVKNLDCSKGNVCVFVQTVN